MTILERLRELIKVHGGDPTGTMTIAEAVHVLTKMAEGETETTEATEP